MKLIVTCGPSFEPIDEVRRITNFSTGELGVTLASAFAHAGHEVLCLKGSAATHPDPTPPCRIQHFDTNEDLLRLLIHASASEKIDAVFHAAALCDYKVRHIEDDQGQTCQSAKIPSRSGSLTLTLEPATKILNRLRSLFPHSLLVGWKYELVGSHQDAIARALRQIDENFTDACIVNGRAYGPGFGFCQRSSPPHPIPNKTLLAQFLVSWLVKPRRSPPIIPAPHDRPHPPQACDTTSPN